MSREDIRKAFKILSDLLASVAAEVEMWFARAADAFAQGAMEVADELLQKAIACEGAIKGIQISLDALAKKKAAFDEAATA